MQPFSIELPVSSGHSPVPVPVECGTEPDKRASIRLRGFSRFLLPIISRQIALHSSKADVVVRHVYLIHPTLISGNKYFRNAD
jgi:hypothetical protein